MENKECLKPPTGYHFSLPLYHRWYSRCPIPRLPGLFFKDIQQPQSGCVQKTMNQMAMDQYLCNWWYTYPPEKYEFVRLDHHPNYWGTWKTCSKPPTSYKYHFNGDEQINRWAYITPSNFDVNYRGTRSWPIPISTNIGIQWTQPPSGNDVNQHCDQRWQLSTKSIRESTILAVEIPTKWQIYSTHLTCHKKNIISCSRFRRWLKFKVYWNPSSIEELSTPL